MGEIVLKGVSKIFGSNIVAVNNIDLTVKDGEFMVLLGPSGCGKTTVLRMIAGLEEVTSGDIIMDGKRINDVDPAERDLAIVFQNYALYPHKSVAGNLSFGLKLRKTPKRQCLTFNAIPRWLKFHSHFPKLNDELCTKQVFLLKRPHIAIKI